MTYIELYHLEEYLFKTVSARFENDKKISAYDFFCIIIWKANRAKSKIAKKLIKLDKKSRTVLTEIVEDLTAEIYQAPDLETKLKILMADWEFRLPMASAILTVLYPNDFTVYDIRVCDELKAHHDLGNKTNFDNILNGYLDYKNDVKNNTPTGISLRDQDRYLWGKSFHKQLVNDIDNAFEK